MPNGITWTCDYLQETVQDVDAQSRNPSEALMCAQAQLQGENGGCQCGGAAMAPIQSTYTDINMACDMCAGQASSVVPTSNYDKTVATGVVGTMNCKGLYDAAAAGTISSTLCPQVQRAAGSQCCSSSGSSSFSRPTTNNNNNSNNNISYNSKPAYNTAGSNGSGNERKQIGGYERSRADARIGGSSSGGSLRGAAMPLP